MNDYRKIIEELLSNPQNLIKKKPFTRGGEEPTENLFNDGYVTNNDKLEVNLPLVRKRIVTQAQFDKELDPFFHDVVKNENIPSICVKIKDGNYQDIKFQRMPVALQRAIKDKQVMHLTRLPMKFTLMDSKPTKEVQENFELFKQYWDLRNQDGMKTKMVDAQLSWGDAGLLYYFDYKGRIKSRLISYKDGYHICSHNDKNGDRILEAIYYEKDDKRYIDCYDDKYYYRFVKDTNTPNNNKEGWFLEEGPVEHGFPEIPLITKRGDVAWNEAENIIEAYEELWNIFNAIQRRWGWGIFYIKGRFKDDGKNIAGSVVLNDTSMDGSGDAKFLTPPTPQGYMDTLNGLFKQIQLSTSTTFLFPEDIKSNGDVSATAARMTKEFDLDRAAKNVIDWQNVADKMVRLFLYGLSVELVNNKVKTNAITELAMLNINAKFEVWQPFNEMEYNTMISMLKGANLLSQESGIELNTLSKPDEKTRVTHEREEAEKRALEAQQQAQQGGEGNNGNQTKKVEEE